MFARALELVRTPLSAHSSTTVLRAQLAGGVQTFACTPVESWAKMLQVAAAALAGGHAHVEAEAMCALGQATVALGEFAAGITLLESCAHHDFAAYAALTHALTEQRRLSGAREALAHTTSLLPANAPDAARSATVERLAARLAHYDWQRDTARAHAEQAVALARGDPTQEALSTLELARHLALYEPERALALAAGIEARFAYWQRPLDVCHARHVQALALQQMGRYSQSLTLSEANSQAYAELCMPHYVAWTENMICINLWRLDRLDEALEAGRRAHSEFVARKLPTLIAMVANNLALVHTWRYEYSAAGELYEDATARCRIAGLHFDEARCLGNLALIHEAVGRYDLALQTHLRSRDLLADDGRETLVPMFDQNIARVLLRLGETGDAEPRLRLARDGFQRIGHAVDAAVTSLLIAELLLAKGEASLAFIEAKRAEDELFAHGHSRDALLAQRLAGEALVALGDRPAGEQTIAAARAAFEELGLVVEAALSTAVLPGAAAAELLTAAQLLDDALPNQAWRAWLALARAGEAEQSAAGRRPGPIPIGAMPEEPPARLDAWTETVRRLVSLRAGAPTEQESATFFEAHAAVFADAMAGALRANDLGAALAAADAALTPAFAAQLARHSSPQSGSGDTRYLTRLVDDEARARTALEAARTSLRSHGDGVEKALLQVRELATDHARALSRLRIARPRPATLQPPDLLDAETLRARCAEAHGERWACLSFHFEPASGTLEIFWLDPTRLQRFERTLTPIELALLRQATDPNPAFRRLVYGGSVYGQKVNSPSYGLRLGRALLPPELWALIKNEPVLYVATHGAMHNLALPVLSNGEATLLDRAEIVHVPSLTALQRLLERGARANDSGESLICGVEEFGNRAPRLPATRGECKAVVASTARCGSAHLLWQEQASRAAIESYSARAVRVGAPEASTNGGMGGAVAGSKPGGALRVLHLATHAIADRVAPMRSRILLHGADELTAAEIVALGLECDLVTLSACSGALGEPLAGNELLSLAYAFLQGGARSVLAALWPVGDAPSAAFMAGFYDELTKEPSARPSAALRRAQNAQMAGSPLDWAGYRLIGAA